MSDKTGNEMQKPKSSRTRSYLTPKKEYTKKVGNYILSEQIGIGTFSKVTKAIHILTGEKVAVKILDKSKIKDSIDIERISREIEILKSISHPNIAQLYESNSTIHNFYLIMEYVEGGDLCDFININLCLNEHLACHFFRQLISVIEYLNEMGITHRDIKPENILLDIDQKNIKVIDFGLSNYCAEKELLQSACGSPCFASPEMLSGKPYNGITTDIWSSGIVLYSMLVGTLPFDDQELNALYEQIKIGTFYIPSTLSLEAIDFLKKILRVNPDKRLNINQIKEHCWFNIEKNKLYKGIDLTVETFPYDEKLILYVIDKFYEEDNDINKDNFIKMVQYHACNQYTATYYLTQNLLKYNKNLKDDSNISINNGYPSNNDYNKKENLTSNNSLKSKNEILTSKSSLKSKKNEIKSKKNIHEENKNDKEIIEMIKDNNDNDNNIYAKKNSDKTQQNLNSDNMKELKEKSNNNHSKNNSINNKYKGKNIIDNNINKKNNNNKENTKINITKKDIVSFKKSPNNSPKAKKKIKKLNLNLLQDHLYLDNTKKLTHRINIFFDCNKNVKNSENNSKSKTKSWQKQEKQKKYKKDKIKNKNKIILDKNKITRNHLTAYNFITDYPKRADNNNSTSHSYNKINNIRFGGSFMKKKKISLTDRANFSNSILAEEQKFLSFNNSKMQSIKTEKSKNNRKNISNKKRNLSNNSKIKKRYENNSMNISKNNFLNKKDDKNAGFNINMYAKKKFPKITYNKYNSKKHTQTNINSEFKKIKENKSNYILTENNHERKDSKLNKVKYPDSTHSSLNMKKISYENNNIKSNNNTINKYKELIDEFNCGFSENKSKNKFKKNVTKLENEYFSSVIQKYSEKAKIKNRNKNILLINPSHNHSISKNITLNNISHNNMNSLGQNYSNNIDENIIKQNLLKNSIKNKKRTAINNGKNKLFQPYKYKKNNLKIDIGFNSKIKNNNFLSLLCNQIKNKSNMNKTHRKNSSFKKNYLSYMKTTKNSASKNIKNPFSQNISMSPETSNNNIKSTDNNKKIINININNILKINKKYSISLTKSSDSSRHSAYHNKADNSEQKNLMGIKNYNSSYPLVSDNNKRYKGAIKYYQNNYTCRNRNEIIYPKMNNEQRTNKNYSSMLKRQLFEGQLLNKNKNF